MKIASWNVNSIRARLEHLMVWLQSFQPDIVLLQEIKVETQVFPRDSFEDLGYNVAVFGQKTYNGVAILSKFPIEDVIYGLPGESEARYIEAWTGHARVASVYVTNGQAVESPKFALKMRFLSTLEQHLASRMDLSLRHHESFVMGGDFNIAPQDRDIYDPDKWRNSILCSKQERAFYNEFLHQGYVDGLRALYPESQGDLYTWWDYRQRAWGSNKGLRIDHFLLTPPAAEQLVAGGVDRTPRGWERPSDHAPLWIELGSPFSH